ncbi:MAG: VOC family protein [Chloroflexota bacterium]|nr:VOC family protein [Chloroflexota bacterium]
MGTKISQLVIDCADPARLAEFWARVLGYTVVSADPGEVEIADAAGSGPVLLFVPVPEPKTVKNRLHIDVRPTDSDQQTELERLVSLGAQPVDVGQAPEVSWIVLADPEENEFCLLRNPAE